MSRPTGRQRIASEAAYWAHTRRTRTRRLRRLAIALAIITAVGAIAATDTPAWPNQATPNTTRHTKEHLA